MTSRFPSPSRTHRSGVTLVELLVVMAVIGILIGILVPVLGPMIWRSSEHVIYTEQKQLAMQIESFNTEYGFYPPDFTQINTPAEFLPYLNKIARNHNELSPDPGGSGMTRLERWWDEVGQFLGPDTALVFWLSALRQSAQYPLTHPDTGVPATAYDVNNNASGERINKFEFKTDRLIIVGNVARYGQPKGNKTLPFIYFNSGYADATTTSGLKEFVAVTAELVVPYRIDPSVTPANPDNYFEPYKFQIISAGLDNKYGTYATPTTPNWKTIVDIKTHRDNITTFSEGRIDKDLD